MGVARRAPVVSSYPRARAAAIARPATRMHFVALEHGSEWRLYRRELVSPERDRRWASRLGFLLAGAAVVAGLKLAGALTWSLL
jgi:hypothetical protein